MVDRNLSWWSVLIDSLTCAIPPTNLVLTTTLSSTDLSNAAFWAARTRLSDAFFTALPAIYGRKTSTNNNSRYQWHSKPKNRLDNYYIIKQQCKRQQKAKHCSIWNTTNRGLLFLINVSEKSAHHLFRIHTFWAKHFLRLLGVIHQTTDRWQQNRSNGIID